MPFLRRRPRPSVLPTAPISAADVEAQHAAWCTDNAAGIAEAVARFGTHGDLLAAHVDLLRGSLTLHSVHGVLVLSTAELHAAEAIDSMVRLEPSRFLLRPAGGPVRLCVWSPSWQYSLTGTPAPAS